MCIEMDIDEDTSGPVPSFDNVQDLDMPEATSHLTEQASNILNNIMNGNAHAGQSKQEDLVGLSADGDENESAEVSQQIPFEEEEQLDLTPELQEGLKILNHFLADKLAEPFRDEVFNHLSEADAEKYKKEIDKPMCLFHMKEKFWRGEYDSITQVVSDFHLIIYNCQRFNGTGHRVSKRANKMAVVLKQKLALLRQDIRSKIAQDSSQPWLNKQDNYEGSFGTGLRKRTINHRLDDSSAMISQLRMEEEQKAKEERKQKKEEHRAAQFAAEKSLIDWEEENITMAPIKSVIQHSWELPQIGLFLFLCRDILGLEEMPMYELERCLAMPRKSRCLHQVMTALLSNENQLRDRMENKGPEVMPYGVWTKKLCRMMDKWYKVLDKTCHGDKFRAAFKLGLVEQSFDVIGLKNPLREKPFHRLSFYKKIWILKSVCDYLVNEKDKFRTRIESQDPIDQRGLLMGTDRHGNQYIHFMQFCGPDLRIYRQRKPPIPVVREQEEEEEEEEVGKPRVKPVKGRSRAKRKLNLDGSNGKRSRSATPMNDSETDGTVSPALSDARSKSRASSSRHSSPMPREINGRSRRASARNSPALDCSSLESVCLNLASGKGRKTRNSAESTFFGNVDVEALFRQNTRRSRGAKIAAKETIDAESVSTLGDESSQDGLRADTPSSTCALDGDVKTEVELVNGKLNRQGPWAQSEGKSESQDSSDADSVRKADQSLDSHVRLFENYKADASDSVHIKLEPDGLKCDRDSEDTQNNAECDKPAESCDIKVKKEPASSTSVSVDTAEKSADGSNMKSSCDTTGQRAAQGNPSSSQLSTTPVSIRTPTSLKKEGSCANDSGFVSFQTSPRLTDPGAVCDKDNDNRIPGSRENNSGVCRASSDRRGVKVKSEDQGEGVVAVKTEDTQVPNEALDDAKPHQNEKPQAASNALLDHADYIEEEMVPDPGDFELIVEDMDDLDRLIKQFEPEQVESSPHISPGARAGKRQKSKSTPKAVKNYACEKDLHEHFVRMQKELQKFRSKLSSSTRRSRLKLQREYLNHVEEVLKEEDLRYWERRTEADSDTEQPVSKPGTGVATSQSGGKDGVNVEEVANSKTSTTSATAASNSSKGKTVPKAAATPPADKTASAECSSGPDGRDIEEYEADVSSRGRLRKRRLIPNNIEDQGLVKKKKIAVEKKAEEVAAVTSGPMAASSVSSSVSNLISTTEDGTIQLHISNEEFLALVEKGGPETNALAQRLAAAKGPSGQALVGWKPQGIRVVGGPIPRGSGDGAQKSGGAAPAATQSSNHPMIQKILSTQSPGTLRPVTGFTTVHRKKTDLTHPTPAPSIVSAHSAAAVTVAVASPSSLVSSVSRVLGSAAGAGPGGLSLHPSPLLMAASMKGGKQQVFVVTPEQQKELMRSGILRPQVRPQAVMQAATTLIRPQAAITTTAAAAGGGIAGLGSAALVSVSQAAASGARQPFILEAGHRLVSPQGHLGVVGSPTPQRHNPSLIPAAQGMVGAPVTTPPKGAVTAVKIVPSSNGQEMVGVPVVVGQVPPKVKGPPGLKPPVIVNSPSGSRTLVLQSGKALPKYAGNVTVKELLESRAASYKTEDGDSSGSQDSSSPQNRPSPSSSSTTTITTPPAHGRVVATTAAAASVPLVAVSSVAMTSPLTVVTAAMPQQQRLSAPMVVSLVPQQQQLQQQHHHQQHQQQLIVPRGVVPPRQIGQSSLDHALQTVVTSYHTTLPTANIKVPSPTTLPSLSPRRNKNSDTRTVPSTKTPIPAITRMEAKQTPLLLTSSLVSGSPLSVNRAVSGVIPGRTTAVVRPGGVVLPAGQTLDVSGKEQVVVQVLPRGPVDVSGKEQVVVQVLPRGPGGVAQTIVLPQTGGSLLQLAGAKLPSGQESSALPMSLHAQSSLPPPAGSTPVAGSAAVVGGLQQQPGCQSLLTAGLPSSSFTGPSSLTGEGSFPALAAAGTKTTSEVLKSMLAAKAFTNPIITLSSSSVSASAVLHTSVASSAAGALMTTQSGPYLSQHAIAPLTQMPRVIRAPVVGVGSAVSNVPQAATTVIHHQGGPRVVQTPLGMQLQSLAVAGLPGASAKSSSQPGDVAQRAGALPGMVRMSLPAGLQLAGVQPGPGGAALRLVPGGQPPVGGSTNLQPVLATIKPGAQGLQQLQLLATATGGLQGIQVTGQPQQQQHLAFKTAASAAGGQSVSVMEDQKPTVQLCFAMPPRGPGVIHSSASSVMPHSVVQGGTSLRAVTATSTLQGSFSVLGSPPISPCNSGTMSKVIMANPATSLPIPAPLQPNNSAVCGSVVNQAPVTALNSARNNRTLLSITPGSVKSQYIISPVSPQCEASSPLLRQHSVPSDGQVLSAQPPPQLQSTCIKRSLSSSDMQPIPAKKACIDTGSSSNNSGAMLAGLNQMIVGGAKTVNVCGEVSTTREPANGGGSSLQRVVMASSAGGDNNSASSTLLNLAAHVSPAGTALVSTTPVSASSVPVVAAPVSSSLLQGMVPPSLVGTAQQAVATAAPPPPPPQKQPVLVVRNVGGQLLTDNNIPVTENNGQYKVLPKATLQLGSQTVTVLSPSSAMIQNVRNPATSSIITAPAVSPHCQTPAFTTPATALSSVHNSPMEGPASARNQGTTLQTVLRSDVKPVPTAPEAGQPDRTDAVCGDSGVASPSGVTTEPVVQEAAPTAGKLPVSVNCSSTPLLKARLEQPRVRESGDTLVLREAVNGVDKPPQQQAPEEDSSGPVQDGPGGGLAQQDQVDGDRGNNVEEETALQLLMLADRV